MLTMKVRSTATNSLCGRRYRCELVSFGAWLACRPQQPSWETLHYPRSIDVELVVKDSVESSEFEGRRCRLSPRPFFPPRRIARPAGRYSRVRRDVAIPACTGMTSNFSGDHVRRSPCATARSHSGRPEGQMTNALRATMGNAARECLCYLPVRLNLNFCPLTEASAIRPPFAIVNTATPLW